ncbi:MAG: DUF115 domain-containing protein [Spirochaetota bacterium]|nr:DUF115 domain-containing protein [Spirochaetota bacterium]
MTGEYSLEKSRNSLPTLKYKDIYIHSKYDPAKEGENLIRDILWENKKCIVIYGMGLAYHVEALIRQKHELKIIIIEKSPEILSLLKKTNRDKLFHSVRLYLGDLNGLEPWLFQAIEEYEADSVLQFQHKVSVSLDPDYYNLAGKIVANCIKYKLQSYITTLGFSRRWHENILKNLRAIDRCHRISKKSDLPVFIIGSGPSLDQHIKELSSLNNKGLVIAIAPVYQRLLDAGVEVHYLITVDGGIANLRHFLPEDKRHANTVLITTLSACPAAIRLWEGEILLINQSLSLEKRILEHCPEVPMRGNVALAAFSVAQHLSDGAIYLIGLDFAFSRGLYHFKGNRLELSLLSSTGRFKSMETMLYSMIHRFSTSVVESFDGERVLTNLAMRSYLEWMEGLVTDSKRMVQSVDQYGARLKGVYQTTIREMIESLKTNKTEFRVKDFQEKLSDSEIMRIRSSLGKLLEYYRKIYESLSHRNIKPDDLKKFLAEKGYGELSELISFSESKLFKKLHSKAFVEDDMTEFINSIRRTIRLSEMAIRL